MFSTYLNWLAQYYVALALAIVSLYFLREVPYVWRLRKFSGPRFTSISNIPHRLAILTGQSWKFYGDACKAHGTIARVAPRLLVTSSPEVWAHVNLATGYQRSAWYYNAVRYEYMRDNVFSERDNAKHEKKRKQLAPGYSGRENLELESSVDECVEQLVDLIRTKYVSSPSAQVKTVNLAQKIPFFTLDVISRLGIGKAFGMLRADKDVDDYLISCEEGLEMSNSSVALGINWLVHTPIIGRLLAPSPDDRNGFGRMITAAYRYIDERAASEFDTRSDMLASFMRHGLRDHELRSEAVEQIFAGSETTASAIRIIILHIMSNTRVYRNLQREIDDAVRNKKAPEVGSSIISMKQAKALPYLQAVIREAMRATPPVASAFSRDLPPGGDTVRVDGKDIFLPGGSRIAYSAYSMHHRQDIYGDDAEVFRPERWFECDIEKLRYMTFTNVMLFGHGKYQCLGKVVAQMEMSKVIFELFRAFDLAIIDPVRPWTWRNHLGLFRIKDMWVQITDREVKY